VKFLIDENVNHQVASILNGIFANHAFVHVADVGWDGLKDIELFPAAAEQGFTGVITCDKRQLSNRMDKHTKDSTVLITFMLFLVILSNAIGASGIHAWIRGALAVIAGGTLAASITRVRHATTNQEEEPHHD
jgi:predicted nuclease of predicted toxin-antitoxin system